MFSIHFLFEIFYPNCASDITKTSLQNWGDYADMSQALIIYVSYTSDVLLICWLGTQLTQHVRQNLLLLLFSNLVKRHVHKVYGASNKLSNYISISIMCCLFFPTRLSELNFSRHNAKPGFKYFTISYLLIIQNIKVTLKFHG
jgi:hypothetical protein